MEKVQVPSTESDFSKAAQLGPRITIKGEGLGLSWNVHSPRNAASKSGKETFLFLIKQFRLWGSLFSGHIQGLPQSERLAHGMGEIMGKKHLERATGGQTHSSGAIWLASQGDRDVSGRLSLKGKKSSINDELTPQ